MTAIAIVLADWRNCLSPCLSRPLGPDHFTYKCITWHWTTAIIIHPWRRQWLDWTASVCTTAVAVYENDISADDWQKLALSLCHCSGLAASHLSTPLTESALLFIGNLCRAVNWLSVTFYSRIQRSQIDLLSAKTIGQPIDVTIGDSADYRAIRLSDSTVVLTLY